MTNSTDAATLALGCLLDGDPDAARALLQRIPIGQLGRLEAVLAELRILVVDAYNRLTSVEEQEALRSYARNLSPNARAILTGSADAVRDGVTVDALHRGGLLHNGHITDRGVMVVTLLEARP